MTRLLLTLWCLLLLARASPGAVTPHVSGVHIPAFAATPQHTLSSGAWPEGIAAGEDVLIPLGAVVTIPTDRTATAREVRVLGTLVVAGQFHVQTLYCAPASWCRFARGAATVWADTPMDTVTDPDQLGHGLVVHDATLSVEGAPVTPYVTLLTAPLAGATVLTLASPPTGWVVGDTVYVPDSSNLPLLSGNTTRGEYATIAALDGAAVTLAAPLTFAHPGSLDGAYLPHLVYVSRGTTFASANPQGVRGHVIAFGHSTLDVRYAAFRDMGRTTIATIDSTTYHPDGTVKHVGTNQIGRYVLHAHHMHQPAHIEGVVVRQSKRWGIALHRTDASVVIDTVVIDADGAGIVTEDGSERATRVERNFVADVFGNLGPIYAGADPNPVNVAAQGVCYWFSSGASLVRTNVAANCQVGFAVFALEHTVTRLDGSTVSPPTLPIQLFEGNHYYGATTPGESTGVNLWGIGKMKDARAPIADIAQSVVQQTVIWNYGRHGFFTRSVSNILYKNNVILGSITHNQLNAMTWLSRIAHNVVVEGATIKGAKSGILVPLVLNSYQQGTAGVFTVRGSTIQARDVGLDIAAMTATSDVASPDSDPLAKHLPHRTVLVSDTTITGTVPILVRPTCQQGCGHSIPDAVHLTNVNGVTGQVYFLAQTALAVALATDPTKRTWGCPVAGLTNEACAALYERMNKGVMSPVGAQVLPALTNGLFVPLGP